MTLFGQIIRSVLATLFLTTVWIVSAAGSEQADERSPAFVSPEAQQKITTLIEDARIRQSLAHIVAIESQLLGNLIELTEIPAPPFGEVERAGRFAGMLREAGLSDVVIDDVGNVIGRRPGRTGDRVVAYTAHLDTVFPAGTDVSVRVEGETLHAPGVGDNTRGLVVLLGVLRALQHAAIETDADILFVGNVGEEGLGDLRGVKHLFREDGPRIDTMIAVDGGKIERIIYGGVGSHRYRVTFEGPGGHSWGAFGTANPHHALGRAIALFDQDAPAVTASGEKTSYNIGRIGGGTSINSIPFESWMEVDMRSGSQRKLDDIDAVLQSAVQRALNEENSARLEGPPLTVNIERVGTRPAARGDSRSPLVQHAVAAMREFGLEANLKISSTDANYPISIGVPAITLSRGGIGEDSHSPAESWQDKNGHIAIQIGLLTVLAEAGYRH
ncbi:MAG: M20/M25/M40 family metallo-hydrolase [Desulfobulbaceae bacterium]|nr:M20/M25/M40 family metallo-hydrolase [Desulfobulbaceae bacterium]